MPLLRTEAEKLSNNFLEAGIIETIIDNEDLFAVLPFMGINNKAYLYNREATISEATFLDPNEVILEGAATFSEHVAKLRILAGDVDVDKFLMATMGDTNNQLALQIRQKVKGIAIAFKRALVQGDSSVDTKSFDGLKKLTHADQIIDAVEAAMSWNMLDELVDTTNSLGTTILMMRPEHKRAYLQLMRTVGGLTPTDIMIPEFGRPMTMHNGIAIITNDYIPVTENAGKKSSPIYSLHLSEDNGVCGLYGGANAGVVVENIGTVQNKDAVRTRVKWYCGLANKHDKAIGRVDNVLL